MWKSIVFALVVGVAGFLAVPVHANFDVKLTATCSYLNDDNPNNPKLAKDKVGNDEVVEACLIREALPATPADVAAHALVFDSDTLPAGELRVIRRCDAAVICSFSSYVSGQSAEKDTGSTISNKSVVIFDLLDVGEGNNGCMICNQSDAYSFSSNKFKFKASCTGILDGEGDPCTLKLKSGKLFEEEGICQ